MRCLFGFYLEFGGVGGSSFRQREKQRNKRETKEKQRNRSSSVGTKIPRPFMPELFNLLHYPQVSFSLCLCLCFLYVLFSMYVYEYMRDVRADVIVLMILLKFDVDESDNKVNRSNTFLFIT